MSVFRDDCHLVLDLFAAWPGPWAELVTALERQPPMLVAEGSSRLFPGGIAVTLAQRLGAPWAGSCGGREALRLAPQPGGLLLASNSGCTREVLAVAVTLPAPPLVLVGVGNGPLARLGGPTRVLLPRPELAIAATVSVYAQALTLAEAVCCAAGRAVPLARLRAGAESALRQPVEPPVVGGHHRIFWCGGEDGLADELGLKTAETIGRAGHACPGTMALHGVEELWEPTDLVVDLGLDGEDAEELRRRAGAALTPVLRLPAYAEDDWSPFDRLVAGWMLLADLALAAGRDPALPRRARKVGNPGP